MCVTDKMGPGNKGLGDDNMHHMEHHIGLAEQNSFPLIADKFP